MKGIDVYLSNASSSPVYGLAASYSTSAAPIAPTSAFAGARHRRRGRSRLDGARGMENRDYHAVFHPLAARRGL
jgi:hypothetical protein